LSDVERKREIEQALKALTGTPFGGGALKLLEVLGYKSNRRLKARSSSPKDFLALFEQAKELNAKPALLDQWQSAEFLFQLTGDEVHDTRQVTMQFEDAGKWEKSRIESYIFLAIELKPGHYTRTDLASITRVLNRLFEMPAMILFKLDSTLTLSVIDRRLHKRDSSRDVLEKVTLIKDVRLAKPHRAHVEILHDLHIEELRSKHEFKSFQGLHDAWRKTLDTSELNKRFYKEIANWYFWALKHVEFPKDAPKTDGKDHVSVIRLITRLIFCWFIKEKGLIPEALFDDAQVGRVLSGFAPDQPEDESSVYYRAILQNLFFATLNTESELRAWAVGKEHFMSPGFYRSQGCFREPDKALDLFKTIPFLNGGLFECLDKDFGEGVSPRYRRVDGFSRRPDSQPTVPDFLFFADGDEVDLSDDYGDAKFEKVEVRGLLRTFEHYKFTVAENTPIEEEVALDPELSGRVFENLLAAYNPETGATARKQTGSFFTPREIVNYMVDEALIACLAAKLEEKIPVARDIEARLRHLFSYTVEDHRFSKSETEALIAAIDRLKVLDPAVGSGAFPMGILHKLVYILGKLDKNNEAWKEKQIAKASEIPDSTAREKAVADIEQAFERNEFDYGRKLYLIENCIYGVDIQPIAVQIAKMRFFISLVVDQKLDEAATNRGIHPLPNLETKFVAANTLIGIDRPRQTALRNPDINQLERELADLRRRHFTVSSLKTKRKLRDRDGTLRSEIADLLRKDGWKDVTARMLAKWDPYDQNAHADFFDLEWMYGIIGGVDIIIGNPPYIQLQANGGRLADRYEARGYLSFARTSDVYCLFYERGHQLLNATGHLCYITSNTWLSAKSCTKLRAYLTEHSQPKLLLALGESVFESAVVDACILLAGSQPGEEPLRAIELKAGDDIGLVDSRQACLVSPTADAWSIVADDAVALFEKMKNAGPPIKKWGVCIYRGVTTGYNEAFIVTKATKDELVARDPRSRDILKPVLRGRDIQRYRAAYADRYLIATFPALSIDINRYPAVRDYLRTFGKRLEQTGRVDARKKTAHRWFETQDDTGYYAEFEKEQLVWIELVDRGRFACVEPGMYCDTSCFTMTGDDIRYLAAVLNSRLIAWYFPRTCPTSGMGTCRWKKTYINEVPVPIPTKVQKASLTKLVAEALRSPLKGPHVSMPDLDAAIDQAVYSLYGLTEDEIAIVEGRAT
jgi:adenine-specific DNA-methyltransferase